MSNAGSVGRGIGKAIKWLMILGALVGMIVLIAIVVWAGTQARTRHSESPRHASRALTRPPQDGSPTPVPGATRQDS